MTDSQILALLACLCAASRNSIPGIRLEDRARPEECLGEAMSLMRKAHDVWFDKDAEEEAAMHNRTPDG